MHVKRFRRCIHRLHTSVVLHCSREEFSCPQSKKDCTCGARKEYGCCSASGAVADTMKASERVMIQFKDKPDPMMRGGPILGCVWCAHAERERESQGRQFLSNPSEPYQKNTSPVDAQQEDLKTQPFVDVATVQETARTVEFF